MTRMDFEIEDACTQFRQLITEGGIGLQTIMLITVAAWKEQLETRGLPLRKAQFFLSPQNVGKRPQY